MPENNKELNQCDGCQRGLPTQEYQGKKWHYNKNVIENVCTKDRYKDRYNDNIPRYEHDGMNPDRQGNNEKKIEPHTEDCEFICSNPEKHLSSPQADTEKICNCPIGRDFRKQGHRENCPAMDTCVATLQASNEPKIPPKDEEDLS